MSKFENWIESHSNKEFVEFHRILDIEKSDKYDKKIGFYISYVLRDRYSIKINSEKMKFFKTTKSPPMPLLLLPPFSTVLPHLCSPAGAAVDIHVLTHISSPDILSAGVLGSAAPLSAAQSVLSHFRTHLSAVYLPLS